MPDLIPKITKTLTHNRQLWTARYSPCGKYLIAGGYDALILRWDVSGDEPKPLSPLTGHHGWVERIAFAGDTLITSDSWGCLTGWKYDQENPQPLWNVEQALDGWIRALALSPDGSTVAVAGNDSSIKLFAVKDGQLLATLPDHTDDVFSLAYHPDGKSLVAGDLKGVVHHWDLAEKKVVRKLEAALFSRTDRIQDCGGVRQLCFDAAGKQLLCGGMKEPGGGFAVGAPLVLVMDWESGKITHEMQHGDNKQGFVYDLAFHPTGFVMATSCAMPGTGLVWFWRIGEPAPFHVDKKLPNGRSLSLHPQHPTLAFVMAVSPNANGRPKGKDYLDGTSNIHFLTLAEKA